ncbi:MAG: ABC transporter ATP-binding protein [Candidatus Ancillula sp.]|jgi:putative ABC transport system ATP-binding protein|nr:ABC transporter ATP-binding protein [Candidatus Ancillula sp.]
MDLIQCRNVSKIYKTGDVETKALSDVSFSIQKGEICVIVGQSGAGKTTLLNLLGGMDTVSSGKISIDGREISKYSHRQLTKYRREDIGFVFQFYNLVPNLTALENVELATEICSDALSPEETLKNVGLESRMYHFPAQLSGGEQQRVSIARAIAKNPKLLLCDEPTGALDDQTGRQILRLLVDTAARYGATVIIITHNAAICDIADQVIRVKSGQIVENRFNQTKLNPEDINW